jgi:hypothetical protein
MKTLLTVTFGVALLIPAGAQTIDINLDKLAAKAKEKAEITLDGSMLTEALKRAPEKVKGSVSNVSRFTLRHYEFEKPGEYSDADIEGIRKQASSSSGWAHIISTKEEHESVDIYMLNQGGKPGGFLLIAAEEKELTVVHVVGSIDLASLKEVVNSTIQYDLKAAEGQ